jgi:hypothetical protein
MKYEKNGPPLLGRVPNVLNFNTPVDVCKSSWKADVVIDENGTVHVPGNTNATVECLQGNTYVIMYVGDEPPFCCSNSVETYYTNYDATLAGAQAESSLPKPHQAQKSTSTIVYAGVPIWNVGKIQSSYIQPGDTIEVGTFCLRDHSASLPDYAIVHTYSQGVTMTVDDNEVTISIYFGHRRDENRSGRSVANAGNFTADTTGLHANVETALSNIPYAYINISQSCQHQSVEKIGAEDESCTVSVWTEPPTDDGLSGMSLGILPHIPTDTPVQFDNNFGGTSSSMPGKILSDQFGIVTESTPGFYGESDLNRGNCGTDPDRGHNNTLQRGETIVLTGSIGPGISWICIEDGPGNSPPIDHTKSVVYAQYV